MSITSVLVWVISCYSSRYQHIVQCALTAPGWGLIISHYWVLQALLSWLWGEETGGGGILLSWRWWVTADNDSFQSSRSPRQLAATTTTEQLRNTQSVTTKLQPNISGGAGGLGQSFARQVVGSEVTLRLFDDNPGITVIVCQSRAMSSPLHLTTNTGGQHGLYWAQSANILSVSTQFF